VAVQSSVQVELRVKLLLEAILMCCKLRTVEIMPFDAKPYHKLRSRSSRRIRIGPMKLLAFQKRATLGSGKYAGSLCCSLNCVVEPEAGLLQPCQTFGLLKPAGNLHMSKQRVVGSYSY
jgi:hypothetical protein